MALNIRLQRNEIKGNAGYGKYFGHVISNGEVGIEDFAKEIQDNCSMKKSDVKAVLDELQETIKRHLQGGRTVVLPDIGRLKLSVETVGVDNPKLFNKAKHLKKVVCRFKPAGKHVGGKNGRLSYSLCEGTEVNVVRAPYAN